MHDDNRSNRDRHPWARRLVSALVCLTLVACTRTPTTDATIGSRGPARVLRVTCSPGTMTLSSGTVIAGRRGIRIDVVGGSRTLVFLNGAELDGVGPLSVEMALPPPTGYVACGGTSDQPGTTVPFSIADPRGLWRDDALACDDSDMLERPGSGVVYEGSATAIAPRTVRGMRDGDEALRVGYPRGNPRSVGILRGGATLAVVDLTGPHGPGWNGEGFNRLRPGRWSVLLARWCPHSGLSVRGRSDTASARR
jgi:hypothetical protein